MHYTTARTSGVNRPSEFSLICHRQFKRMNKQNNVFGNSGINNVLFVTVKPLGVEIISRDQPLSVGRKSELWCKTMGARPPATITWWLGGKKIEAITKESVRHILMCYDFKREELWSAMGFAYFFTFHSFCNHHCVIYYFLHLLCTCGCAWWKEVVWPIKNAQAQCGLWLC